MNEMILWELITAANTFLPDTPGPSPADCSFTDLTLSPDAGFHLVLDTLGFHVDVNETTTGCSAG